MYSVLKWNRIGPIPLQDQFLRDEETTSLLSGHESRVLAPVQWESALALACCVCIYRVRKAEWWIEESRQAADEPEQREQDTRPGRKGSSRDEEKEGGRPSPRRHICHHNSQGASRAWELLSSPPNPPLVLHAPTSPSTGLGPALPGWDPVLPLVSLRLTQSQYCYCFL